MGTAPACPAGCTRRRVLGWLGAAAAAPVAAAGLDELRGVAIVQPVDVVRAGGVAVMLRHAATEPGIGDPPEFRLGDCGTQRNLSDAGRAQARRIGAWFEQQRLAPAAVRSSAWCRCIDTARLAFGREQRWPPLDSLYRQGGRTADEEARLRALDAALRAVPPGRFEVWVTHQVNITAATGEPAAMGEALVVRAAEGAPGRGAPQRLRVVARLDFGA